MNSVLAVFIAPGWSYQAIVRLWVKQLRQQPKMVLVTDDVTEGNTTLLRQLKCSSIVGAVVRMPGVMRSEAELERARLQRDAAMADLASIIYDFGDVPGGPNRFAGKQTVIVSKL